MVAKSLPPGAWAQFPLALRSPWKTPGPEWRPTHSSPQLGPQYRGTGAPCQSPGPLRVAPGPLPQPCVPGRPTAAKPRHNLRLCNGLRAAARRRLLRPPASATTRVPRHRSTAAPHARPLRHRASRARAPRRRSRGTPRRPSLVPKRQARPARERRTPAEPASSARRAPRVRDLNVRRATRASSARRAQKKRGDPQSGSPHRVLYLGVASAVTCLDSRYYFFFATFFFFAGFFAAFFFAAFLFFAMVQPPLLRDPWHSRC